MMNLTALAQHLADQAQLAYYRVAASGSLLAARAEDPPVVKTDDPTPGVIDWASENGLSAMALAVAIGVVLFALLKKGKKAWALAGVGIFAVSFATNSEKYGDLFGRIIDSF